MLRSDHSSFRASLAVTKSAHVSFGNSYSGSSPLNLTGKVKPVPNFTNQPSNSI